MSDIRLPRTAVSIAVLLLLLTTGAVLEARHLTVLSSLSSADLWWHLRTGTWILENRAAPHSALSTQSATSSWIDPNWAFDALFAALYRLLGLRALAALLMILRVALAATTFALAAGCRGPFWPAVAISAGAQYILGALPPGPVYCSAIFFGLELLLLLEVRRSGRTRLLFFLPPFFFAWANVDEHFGLGLALLVIFLLAAALEGFFGARSSAAQAPWAGFMGAAGVTALSFAATALTPYFFRPYGVLFARLTSAGASVMPDSHAMNFKQPQDYFLLLLTMAGFLALGRRRSRDFFQIGLLVACTLFGFHAQRDVWVVTLAATAVLGEALRGGIGQLARGAELSQPLSMPRPTFSAAALTGIAAGAVAVVIVALLRIPADRGTLLARVARAYPVAACDIIRARRLPQPIFNSYEWGGFLLWYLPEYPVAIDSRPSLYPDDVLTRYAKVMNADLPYTADPGMSTARTLVLPRHSLMGEALSTVPAFQVSYADDVSIVLLKAES